LTTDDSLSVFMLVPSLGQSFFTAFRAAIRKILVSDS
jgi:hypothetical protein